MASAQETVGSISVWEERFSLERLRRVSTDSSVVGRVQFWQALAKALGQGKDPVPERVYMAMAASLLHTLPRYADRESRKAVLTALTALGSRITWPTLATLLGPRLGRMADAPGLEGGTRFSSLAFVNTLLQYLGSSSSSSSSSSPPFTPDLVRTQATLLASLIQEGPRGVKSSMVTSSITSTRRAIRHLLPYISSYCDALLPPIKASTTQLSTYPPRYAVALGEVIGVIQHARPHLPGCAEAKELLNPASPLHSRLAQYQIMVILGSREPLPKAWNRALAPILRECEGDKGVLEQTEKMLLRSPDASLPVVAHLAQEDAYRLKGDVVKSTERSFRIATAILKVSPTTPVGSRADAMLNALLGVFHPQDTVSSIADLGDWLISGIIDPIRSGRGASLPGGAEGKVVRYRLIKALASSPYLSAQHLSQLAEGLSALVIKETGAEGPGVIALGHALSSLILSSSLEPSGAREILKGLLSGLSSGGRGKKLWLVEGVGRALCDANRPELLKDKECQDLVQDLVRRLVKEAKVAESPLVVCVATAVIGHLRRLLGPEAVEDAGWWEESVRRPNGPFLGPKGWSRVVLPIAGKATTSSSGGTSTSGGGFGAEETGWVIAALGALLHDQVARPISKEQKDEVSISLGKAIVDLAVLPQEDLRIAAKIREMVHTEAQAQTSDQTGRVHHILSLGLEAFEKGQISLAGARASWVLEQGGQEEGSRVYALLSASLPQISLNQEEESNDHVVSRTMQEAIVVGEALRCHYLGISPEYAPEDAWIRLGRSRGINWSDPGVLRPWATSLIHEVERGLESSGSLVAASRLARSLMMVSPEEFGPSIWSAWETGVSEVLKGLESLDDQGLKALEGEDESEAPNGTGDKEASRGKSALKGGKKPTGPPPKGKRGGAEEEKRAAEEAEVKRKAEEKKRTMELIQSWRHALSSRLTQAQWMARGSTGIWETGLTHGISGVWRILQNKRALLLLASFPSSTEDLQGEAWEAWVSLGKGAFTGLGLTDSTIHGMAASTLRCLPTLGEQGGHVVPRTWKEGVRIKDQILRALYKLRFMVDVPMEGAGEEEKTRSLNLPSFLYLLPLLAQVIEGNGVGYTQKEREADQHEDAGEDRLEGPTTEQMTLAVEILAAQCHGGLVEAGSIGGLLPQLANMLLWGVVMDGRYGRVSVLGQQALAWMADNGDESTGIEKEALIQALLRALLGPQPLVRDAALDTVMAMDLALPSSSTEEGTMTPSSSHSIPLIVSAAPAPFYFPWRVEVWIGAHMEAAGIDATCQALWKRNEGCEITPDLDLSPLIDLATPGEIAARGLGDGVIEGAAKALGAFLLFQEPSTPQGISRIQEALDLLIQRYNTLALPFGPEYDAYGLVIPSTVGRKDPWEGRVGCGMALRELIKVLVPSQGSESGKKERLELSKDILAFLLGGGKVASSKIPAVADRHPRVREAMVAVGMELVKGSNDTSDTKATALSKERVLGLLPVLEASLSNSSDKLKAEEEDWVRQAGAILSGQASTSLPKTDSRLDGIGNLLLQTLKVPSEGVQSAVSECLMTVSALRPKKALEWVGPLVEEAIRGDGYAVQRGAAYGLAGLAGGIGIGRVMGEGKDKGGVLKAIEEVLPALEENGKDKGQAAMLRETRFQREGALGIVEIIGWRGGRAFEAYAVSLVPRLLAALGDGDNRVREAAQAASTAAVSCMGSYARVRLLLPPLLLALSDRAKWRAQVGAAALMGALAGAGVRRKSSELDGEEETDVEERPGETEELTEAAAAVLPQAVPALVEAAGEAHGMVASAARSALERLGGVVQSPEISSLAPLLLQALFTGHALPRATLSPGSQGTSEGDPLGKALLALLRKVFLHRMDAPSLALVVPVVSKGLRASSAGAGKESTTSATFISGSRRREVAAQVVGAMASLADARDLVPYLPSLTKQLMEALGDAVPEVRAVAARSLGRLVEELGEDGVPGVTDLLKSALIDPATGGVERQGAAQGLAEVFAALGSQRLPSLLPDIVSQTEAPQRSTREGALLLLVYLPATAGAAFAPHLPTVVPAILRGLADEGADVRAASLRAARMIVRGHAQGAVHLLLPELEGGLFAESWRIRAAAVQLVGELLLNVGGASSVSGDQDGSKGIGNSLGNTEVEEDEEGAEEEEGEEDEEGEGDEDEELEDKPRPKMPTSLLARLSTVLGVERRDRVLSSLYITRMDESAAVRHALLPVWKALVSNTPKTVREILEPIMSKVMQLLSDPLDSWRSLGGRVLGEMVRKLGERVVRRIVPILVETSCSEDATIRLRAGALRGLGGILNGPSGRAIVEDEEELVVRSVQQGLVAKSGRVRRAAAGVFDALVSITSGGGGAAAAVGAVVPGLLAMLETQGPGVEEAGEESTERLKKEQRALQALCVLVGVRAAAVLPPLLPTLLDPIPLTSGHVRALTALLAGNSEFMEETEEEDEGEEDENILEDLVDEDEMEEVDEDDEESLSGRGGVVGVVKRQLPIILSALLPSLEASPEDPGLLGLSDALVGACASPDTLHLLMGTLLERAKTCIQGGAGGSRIRVVQPLSLASSLILLSSVCRLQGELLVEEEEWTIKYGPEWVRLVFIGLATSDQAQLVRIAHGALSAIFSPTILPKAEGPLWVQPIRRSLRLVKKLIGPTECVAGFSLPKGLGPIMPIFTNGLLGGSVDAREQSALGMDEIIRLTEPMALKTYVTQMTGSLIRIMGERVTAPVKAAILGALLSLLRRCPLFLRPFLPQLQRSFVRALADPVATGTTPGVIISSTTGTQQSVRSRAAEALGALMGLAQAKVDPVITELAGLYHNTTDSSGDVEEEGERREGILEAISSILVVVGPKKVLGEASLDLIEGLVEAGYDDPRASVVRGASRCVGPLTLAYGDRTKVRGLNKAVLFSQEPGKALASIWSLRSLAKTGEALNQLDGGKGEVWSAATQRIQEAIQYGKPDMAQVAIETAGWMVVRLNLLGRTKETEKLMNHLIQLFSPSGGPSIAGELKRAAILAVKRAYKQSIPEPCLEQLNAVIPPLVLAVKDRHGAVKTAAERTLLHVLALADGKDRLVLYQEKGKGEASVKRALSSMCEDGETLGDMATNYLPGTISEEE